MNNRKIKIEASCLGIQTTLNNNRLSIQAEPVRSKEHSKLSKITWIWQNKAPKLLL